MAECPTCGRFVMTRDPCTSCQNDALRARVAELEAGRDVTRELALGAHKVLTEWSGSKVLTDDEHEAICDIWQRIGDVLHLWTREHPAPI